MKKHNFFQFISHVFFFSYHCWMEDRYEERTGFECCIGFYETEVPEVLEVDADFGPGFWTHRRRRSLHDLLLYPYPTVTACKGLSDFFYYPPLAPSSNFSPL